MPALALILSFAYLWFALLENRKIYELRRHQIEIPSGGRRVLLVCNQKVRKQFGLSNQMAVAHCTERLGPFTADEIISQPSLRGGILISDEDLRRYLPNQSIGYLYHLEKTKMSSSFWADTRGNGSNCFGFFECPDPDGNKRWTCLSRDCRTFDDLHTLIFDYCR
jgi:hypothetical protein